MKPLTLKQAFDVYQILIDECGAVDYRRDYFAKCQCLEFVPEYRFRAFDFYAGFCRDRNGCRVECHESDSNPYRARAIDAANARLRELFGGSSVTESEVERILEHQRRN